VIQFPSPPPGPVGSFFASVFNVISLADTANRKKLADVELGPRERLIIRDDDTGARYRIKIASGVLDIEAL
jgi:hypothetical protein